MLVGKVQNKAIVSDQQGQVVGRLVGLLFNPATEQVTHLLVKTSWKADQLKMIEFDCVELPSRTALSLALRLNTSQLANQPWLTDFEEAATQSKKGIGDLLSSRAVIYDPQFQNEGRTECKSTQLFIKRVRFDYSKTPLYLGLPVQALDGRAGTLDQVSLDWNTGQLVELIIKRGWLDKSEVTLPLSAVDQFSTHGLKMDMLVQQLLEESQSQTIYS